MASRKYAVTVIIIVFNFSRAAFRPTLIIVQEFGGGGVNSWRVAATIGMIAPRACLGLGNPLWEWLEEAAGYVSSEQLNKFMMLLYT